MKNKKNGIVREEEEEEEEEEEMKNKKNGIVREEEEEEEEEEEMKNKKNGRVREEEEEEEEEAAAAAAAAALNPPHVRTVFQSRPRSSRPVGAVNVKHTCGRARCTRLRALPDFACSFPRYLFVLSASGFVSLHCGTGRADSVIIHRRSFPLRWAHWAGSGWTSG